MVCISSKNLFNCYVTTSDKVVDLVGSCRYG
nr:MAG TPA: hypothetical protein [Caudoviricetes sp.]